MSQSKMTKKRALVVLISAFLVAMVWLVFFRGTPGNSGNSGNPESRVFAERTLNVFNSLQVGNNSNAAKDFLTGENGPDVTPGQLGVQWSYIKQVWGPCKEYVITHAEDNYEDRSIMYTVYVTCRFEKGTLYGVVNFGPQKKISGFRMSDRPQR